MKFSSGKEMYEELMYTDLYSDEQELYVYMYNEDGAICVYDITNHEAEELENTSKEIEECWSACLTGGGKIYDDPLEFCNECYMLKWRGV